MITVVVAVISYAAISGLTTYYNIGVEMYGFASALIGEVPDAVIVTYDRKDTEGVIQRLREREDVRMAFGYQQVYLLSGDTSTLTFVTEDFSQLEGGLLVEGRYPKYSNEIAVGSIFSQIVGKGIGETVSFVQGEKTREFFITGFIQAVNNDGNNIGMTLDGLLSLQSDFKFEQIYVYLNEGTDVEVFFENVKTAEGEKVSSFVDMKETADAMFGSYSGIFAAVAFGILGMTALVVILTLYLVIKTIILRRRREFGIQKALGYTTLQLMNQIALQFTPIVLTGVALGGAGGYFGFNALFIAITRGMGIMKVNMPSPLDWTLAACLR